MATIPPVPHGMTVSEFGDRLWGTGPDEADSRLGQITRDKLLDLGLTYEMAKDWCDFYDQQSKRKGGLPTSLVRVKLLARCMELLR